MAYDETKLTNLGQLKTLAQRVKTEFTTVNANVHQYSIVKDDAQTDFAAVYHLTQDGTNVGAAINIPKDMVVQSGEVVTNPTGKPRGTYIKLVLQNVEEPLYINAANLIEYVTSGSGANDAVIITVDETTHKVTAALNAATQTLLDSVASGATKVEASTTNGNIKINGVDTVVYTLPDDVLHGSIATGTEVGEMLTEVFG